jgi:hypothetical protein
VNVTGTLRLLRLAVEQSRWHGERVKFMFPSSIAAYGMPSLDAKASAGRVREDEHTMPSTMYGINKLYCEHLGRYYDRHYRQLAADEDRRAGVDFRSIRFPGLISAFTVPSGGTSDYGPEMVHSAPKVSRTPASCGPIPHQLHGHARRHRRADAAARRACREAGARRLQHHRLQPERSRVRRAHARRVPGQRHHLRARHQAAGHRGLVAAGHRRLGRPRRLGLRAQVRLRADLRRVPAANIRKRYGA